MELFDRKCEVILGQAPSESLRRAQYLDALKVTDLRIAFKIEKSLRAKPNNSEIQIYNLSKPSREKFLNRHAPIILSAGYGKESSQVFSGEIRFADHVQDKADWISKIEAGDGERAFVCARVSESFKPGVTVKEVVMRIAKALELDLGNIAEKSDLMQRKFNAGFTMHGKAAKELSRILKANGYSWSIQNNAIQVLADTEVLPGTSYFISPDTGLVGSVEHASNPKNKKQVVVKFKALMIPSIRPGQAMHVEASGFKGDIKVIKTTHQGDTHSTDWYVLVESVLLPGGGH